ncbi:hypothetical protein [Roseateles sp. BYS87W]|uniref:Peptidase M61 catalytic domain-containing protein n=1 Tax=Pelomonas baiyunensis TaxID=3299026 RepID=A0ABW7H4S8_9BURK
MSIKLPGSIASLLLALTTQASAGELLIEQRLTDDGSLLVSYTPPPGVREVPLFNQQEVMHTVWTEMAAPLGHCASVTLKPRVTVMLAAGCRSAIFRITPRLLNRYAVNEPAFPAGRAAVMTYLGFFSAVPPGHTVRWRWVANRGARTVVAGQVSSLPIDRVLPAKQVAFAAQDDGKTQAGFDASGSHEYVWLGSAEIEQLPGGVLIHDQAVDATVRSAVRDALRRNTARLARAYGVAPAGPWTAVTSSAPGLHGFRGDVTAGRMMSLRFDPAVPQGFDIAGQVQRFVAHEVTHWWDTGIYRTDADRPWIHEGHAEWMAGLLMREAGLYSPDRWQASLETALNNCLFARSDRASATLPTGFNRDDDTYACGQTLMLLAQATRPRDAAPVDMAASLFQNTKAAVDVAAIARWADSGQSGRMHRLLLDPQQGFSSALQRDWRDVLDIQDLVAGTELPSAVRSRLGSGLMGALMTADCGRMGFWTQADHFRIESIPSCHQLRGDMRVGRIAGISPFSDPVGAWQAASSACAAGLPVALDVGPAATVSVTCPTPFPDLPIHHVLRLRPQALERLGLAP